jgi:hypothetical protein
MRIFSAAVHTTTIQHHERKRTWQRYTSSLQSPYVPSTKIMGGWEVQHRPHSPGQVSSTHLCVWRDSGCSWQPDGQLLQDLSLLFLRPSAQKLGQYLKLGHDLLFPCLFQCIIQSLPYYKLSLIKLATNKKQISILCSSCSSQLQILSAHSIQFSDNDNIEL